MANIKTVQPIHFIDEGRLILNDNDTAMNNEIANLSNIISNHNHNDIYYTKSEIDSRKVVDYIQVGLDATAIGTFAKIGSVQMSTFFGIVVPRNGLLTDIIAIYQTGEIFKVKNGFPLPVMAGDVISIAYTQYTANDVIRVYKSGFATETFVKVSDGVEGSSKLGKYILLLEFQFNI